MIGRMQGLWFRNWVICGAFVAATCATITPVQAQEAKETQAEFPFEIELLFDAKPPRRPDALPGGNGLAFDWGLIADRSWRRPWMLSGGLTAEVLPEAVRISGAAAVDVSSGDMHTPWMLSGPVKVRAILSCSAPDHRIEA